MKVYFRKWKQSNSHTKKWATFGAQTLCLEWLGFDGMSVCDCRSLLSSVHYRIVAEHVTQRSGMHIYVNLRTIEQLLWSRFAEQEQGHIYKIVSSSPLQHRRLCHSSKSVRLASLFQHHKEEVFKTQKSQSRQSCSWLKTTSLIKKVHRPPFLPLV